MKTITITEEQYCYILKNRFNLLESNLISESVINENVIGTLFKGCSSFNDFVNRLAKLLAGGVITIAMAYSIFNKVFPNPTQEQQAEIEQVVSSVETVQNVQPQEINGPAYKTQYVISEDGINHVKNEEKLYIKGYSATQYEAKCGVVTVGYGHVITDKDPKKLQNVKMDFLAYLQIHPEDYKGLNYSPKYTITPEDADAILRKDVKTCEMYVKTLCKQANPKFADAGYFNQGLMDAMISMMFSGYGNFENSPFYKNLCNCRIKNGKLEESDFNFTVASLKNSVIKQGGKIIDGLKARRAREYSMAMSDR